MAIKTPKLKPLAYIRDIDGCGNCGCMAISGMRAWALKTNREQTLSVLYYFSNVNQKVTKTFPVKNLLGHGNGMTFDQNYLYFACWKSGASAQTQNRYILRVPRGFNGDWKKGIRITTPNSPSAISYYKPNQMIVNVASDVPGHRKYAIGKIHIDADRKSGSMSYISYFYVKFDRPGEVGQDIFFDTKKNLLFIPLVEVKNGRMVASRIYVTDLAGDHTTLNGHNEFTPKDILLIPSSTFGGLEVESLGLDSDRKIVLCGNLSRRNYDRFFRITNLTF